MAAAQESRVLLEKQWKLEALTATLCIHEQANQMICRNRARHQFPDQHGINVKIGEDVAAGIGSASRAPTFPRSAFPKERMVKGATRCAATVARRVKSLPVPVVTARTLADNDDSGTTADYIVVEIAKHLLGENWMPDYVKRANDGGIERVLV